MKIDRLYFILFFVGFLGGLLAGSDFEVLIPIVGAAVLFTNVWREFRTGFGLWWSEPVGKVMVVISQEILWFVAVLVGVLVSALF